MWMVANLARRTACARRGAGSVSAVPALGLALALVAAAAGAAFAQSPADPAAQIRSLVASGQFGRAEEEVDGWLRQYPGDLDARAWRARLWAWTNRWPEAEAEYRVLLEQLPEDVDLMAGLADVLYWQHRSDEALALLDRGCAIDPNRADIRLRRAQALQQLGRLTEARAAYEDTLTRAPGSEDAKRALAALRDPGRHELRFGSDLDRLSDGPNGGVVLVSLGTRWNDRWRAAGSLAQYERFGVPATQIALAATRRFGASRSLTAVAAVANDQDIVPRAELEFEYGHGIHGLPTGVVRGADLMWRQRWLWYSDASVVLLTPGVLVYLPNNWSWLVWVSANRVAIDTAGSTWEASGWTRLTFPLRPSLEGFVTFAAGAENYAYRDQIAGFSARAGGGGVRWRVTPGQDLTCHGQYQRRSTGQAQTSFGASYGFRF